MRDGILRPSQVACRSLKVSIAGNIHSHFLKFPSFRTELYWCSAVVLPPQPTSPQTWMMHPVVCPGICNSAPSFFLPQGCGLPTGSVTDSLLPGARSLGHGVLLVLCSLMISQSNSMAQY